MKKLLGILGTITIAGSGVAGLVGNAPAKNNINYQQTNNLETLNRNKRNPYDNYYGSGQQTFDINHIYTNKSFSIPRPTGYGNRNWVPQPWQVVVALVRANPQAGNNRSALSANWITKHSARIFALPNTPFYGSFNVNY